MTGTIGFLMMDMIWRLFGDFGFPFEIGRNWGGGMEYTVHIKFLCLAINVFFWTKFEEFLDCNSIYQAVYMHVAYNVLPK